MSEERTLRDVCDERGFNVGAAVAADPLISDAGYKKTLRREFNTITPENALKMGPLRPSKHVYDFSDADAVVDFGRANDMRIRGHTLVWHNQTPDWFREWEYTPDQLRKFIRDHVNTVVGRYRDAIADWDVVNEAVADDGSMRDSLWHEALGEEYLDIAFEAAHQVAPETDLYYNDYGADEINEKSDAIYDLVERMLDRGVPIDGVGLQMHALHSHPDPESVAENIRRFQDLGLEVQITEMDVAFPEEDKPENHLERQADYYADIVEACLETGCDTIVVWGVRDSDSWVPGWFETVTDDPLLFDRGNDPKPAYHAISDALSE